jgi:rhodanese-related sulfurtransferase
MLEERTDLLDSLLHSFVSYPTAATIVLHCASGRRAAKAQEVLEKQGYKHVMNAGGFADFQGFFA